MYEIMLKELSALLKQSCDEQLIKVPHQNTFGNSHITSYLLYLPVFKSLHKNLTVQLYSNQIVHLFFS